MIVLYNVKLPGEQNLQTISFQYKEQLVSQQIEFDLYFDSMREEKDIFGHQSFDLQGGGILVNSHQNVPIDEKISTIFDINQKLMLI